MVTANFPAAGVSVSAGTLRLASAAPNQATRVNTVTVTAGNLDLTNNDLIISTASISSVTGALQAAYANGAWNGPGIFSSTAAASPGKAIGVATGLNYQTLHPGSTFDGQAVNSSDVLLKYTYQGDADLDGRITMNDYALINAGFFYHPFSGSWVGGVILITTGLSITSILP